VLRRLRAHSRRLALNGASPDAATGNSRRFFLRTNISTDGNNCCNGEPAMWSPVVSPYQTKVEHHSRPPSKSLQARENMHS
jgi:hypothetical protein